ncbi:efflux RND transporter periplasmic adaptor subunit [Leuconostoc miyukkimchii]|uniref:efflux RND transporter periplasmic adaptor subunit n=1 Tax=Leuconostoc miyukkimchii TaxID=910540 RepID=UPI001C7DA0FA|nr:efflux RND transporter periplasmic adaptor subunit [Leuconostoc miyukkimchii]
MKKRTKVVLITVSSVVAVGLLTVTSITTYNKMTHKASSVTKKGYQSYRVTSSPALSMSGKIVANKTQTLNSPSGKIQQINVNDGQTVKNGEILLTVTNTDIQEAIEAQNDVISKATRGASATASALKSAQQQYQQASDEEGKAALKDTVAQAQQATTDANADLQDAQNKLVELQNKLNVSLTAPFDGIVSVDNNTKDGIPSLTMNTTEKVLRATVSEYDYDKIHSGDSVTVSGIDGTPTQTTAIDKIEQIPAEQGKGTTYYPFSANVNGDFLYGQSVKVKVPQNDLKIPSSAVYKGSIYKVIDGKASRINADVTKSGTSYFIKSGVVKGEKIVLNPDSHLKNGEAIND